MEDRKKFEKMITNWDNLVNEFQDNVNTDYFEILQEENINLPLYQCKSRDKRRYNEIIVKMDNTSRPPIQTKRFKFS